MIAVGALGLFCACGGSEDPQPQEQAVVARAVAPPVIEDDGAAKAGNAASDLPEADTADGSSVTALPTADPNGTDEQPTPSAPRSRSRSTRGAILSAADRSSFTRHAAQLGGASGLSVSGVGLGRKVEHVGTLNSLVAWSTTKVPVAMAVVDAGGQNTQQANLRAAITTSDNDAATRLWSSIGTPQEAAAAADAELRQSGDTRTHVESQTLRYGSTPFGQTEWGLNDQTRFTAGLPCSAAGQAVLGLMGQVVPAQRWGLGSMGAGAQLKGGWGPGSQPGKSGGYLNRQMGIVTISGKQLAVAVATVPTDGSHESGTRNLTAIARWLAAHANVKAQPASPAC
jgi:hypothetical protein